jgi:hypothetical protein
MLRAHLEEPKDPIVAQVVEMKILNSDKLACTGYAETPKYPHKPPL